ncbi:GspE/PulE family protein [Fusobacterium sp. IOR10]|uniref:GspE/PulE family protein n=1 Tax=Fusobacterium sp. IOR10 TaxID=2665157 RepID=UPI0013D30EF0|nr:GspE/PulE family protein [Fusobacterium sp. IOR10]
MIINEERKQLYILDYRNIKIMSKSYIDSFINYFFQQAINNNSSDIHIEPGENFFRIRYRQLGELMEFGKYDLEKYKSLLSRIKIICGLDIAEKRIPQEGRFNGVYGDNAYDFRISIIPVYFGEKISVRILKRKKIIKSLIDLGFNEEIYKNFLKCLNKKSGLILISGPMGSGKTTSLYSILNEINTEDRNIVTVEDPVEYVIEGINQIQCNEDLGLSFSKLLKIILRQDADVIAIGEIRDNATASVALTASLTGHLILSTIHSKNSVSSLKRLQDLGINIDLLYEGITGVFSQKLIRKLCPHCKVIDRDYLDKIKNLNLSEINFRGKKIYKRKGCSFCNQTGYIDRIPISEFLLKKKQNFCEDLTDKNISNFFEATSDSIFLDGLKLVFQGETSLDELLRVI